MTSTALIVRPMDLQLSRNFIYTSRFEETVHQQWESDADIWVVKASVALRKAAGRTWTVWIEKKFYESRKHYDSPILSWISGLEKRKFSGGFCEGRPLAEFCIRVPLCVGLDLPQKLYRVVHGKHPFSGTRARGYGRVEVNPITFQIHFQRHLNGCCRDLSPFMSATPSIEKAMRIAAKYERLELPNIEVLVINTNGSAWEDTFIFNAQRLVNCFQLTNLARNSNLKQEYLIQDEIPRSLVVRASLYNIKSQWCIRWRAAWRAAERWSRQNDYSKKRKFGAEGAEQAPRKRQVRTHKYRKVRD